MTGGAGRTLSAVEAADRLGVELATVYAYVSRGALTRRPGPGGRSSRYDADEVELLARRARPRSTRRRPGAIDVVIGTTISEIGDGWIRYRGIDLLDLAGRHRFEAVAALLWTGALPHPDDVVEPLDPELAAAARRVTAALPRHAGVSARLAAAAASVAPMIAAADPTDASTAGRSLVHALVAGLDPLGDDAGPAATVAERLWRRISPLAPTAARVRALDVALVLLAEHELATSTLAVRVAASTGAGPADALLAGLGAVAGPLHGRAAVAVHERLLGTADGPIGPDASAVADDRPHADGFGHLVHGHGDPRFAPLHAAVDAIAPAGMRARIRADLAAHAAPGRPAPNVDAALGALGYVARAEPGATEAIFAIARTAGWLAHAFEEADEQPLRFRGRTLYRGPR